MALQEQDRELFTQVEWALIQSSEPSKLKAQTPARLKAQLARARTYADKYVDLSRRQRRTNKAASSRGGGQDQGRTARKAKLLKEALNRFEKGLQKRREQSSPATGRSKKPSGNGAQIPKNARKLARHTGQGLQPSRKKTSASGVKQHGSTRNMRATQGHIRAQGKRRQARRDAR